MTVTAVHKDPTALTLTITAEFAHPVERVWQLWADPRQLERWWGPPTHPATVVRHELRAGGQVTYYMTSPEGDRYHGWWTIRAVDAPRHLEFVDGFADGEGNVLDQMPSTVGRVTIERVGEVTRMTTVSTFASLAAMEQLIEMGMEEGITLAMGQIDGILAESQVGL